MMTPNLPVAYASHRPPAWGGPETYANWPWESLYPLPPLVLADGSGLARQQTEIRVCWDPTHLYVRFDCADRDIWGTATARDAAIFDEEVVELFIAPGKATPVDYFEFEVSPLGTLLDLTVHSPDGNRATLTADFAWDCPGLLWEARREDARGHWTAFLGVPWRSLCPTGLVPRHWRANFYRIERPRGQAPEFSCWSPTMSEPADYHRPAYFGHLRLATT
jgi:hypothetical protein